MLIGFFVVLFVLSGVLAFLGLRGKRLDDHPVCRACSFDLFGLYPDRPQCPECGADVSDESAVRIGNRKLRRGMIVSGVVLEILMIAALAVVLMGTELQPYKPVAWLRIEAKHFTGTTGHAACDELASRVLAGKLSAAQMQGIADDVLALQADMTTPWDPKRGDLLEAMQAAGGITQTQWQTYATQAITGTFSLKVRKKVRKGDPIPYRITSGRARIGRSSWPMFSRPAPYWQMQMSGKVIDLGLTKPLLTHNSPGGLYSLGPSGISTSTYIELADEQFDQLKTGKQKFSIQLLVEVYSKKNGPVLVTRQIQLDAAWELVDEDTPTARFVTDPSLKSAVAASLKPQKFDYYPNQKISNLQGIIRIKSPPTYIEFDVYADVGNRELKIGNVYCPKGGVITFRRGCDFNNMQGFSATKIDLILRPSLDRAVRKVDVFEVWGEEIIFKDVPVEHMP